MCGRAVGRLVHRPVAHEAGIGPARRDGHADRGDVRVDRSVVGLEGEAVGAGLARVRGIRIGTGRGVGDDRGALRAVRDDRVRQRIAVRIRGDQGAVGGGIDRRRECACLGDGGVVDGGRLGQCGDLPRGERTVVDAGVVNGAIEEVLSQIAVDADAEGVVVGEETERSGLRVLGDAVVVEPDRRAVVRARDVNPRVAIRRIGRRGVDPGGSLAVEADEDLPAGAQAQLVAR